MEFLNLGTPEVAVAAAAAWFLLGPTQMYKLARDVGKFVGSIRELATNSYNGLTSAMEEELERQELKDLGIDVSVMPRRTSNPLAQFMEATSIDDSPRNSRIFEGSIELSPEERRLGARPTRKQIKQRQQQLLQERGLANNNTNVEPLSGSSSLEEDIGTASVSDALVDLDLEPPDLVNVSPLLPDPESIGADVGMDVAYDSNSKFAEQLNGAWNAKVMQQEAEAKAEVQSEAAGMGRPRGKPLTREDAEKLLERAEEVLRQLRREVMEAVEDNATHGQGERMVYNTTRESAG